jgi:tRNA(adenine34) deaminase
LASEQLVSYNASVVTEMHLINKTDEHWMELALTQAAQAMALGEVPVGAVAVLDGRIIAEGFNVKEAEQDPTAHAELVVLRKAAQILGKWRLGSVTLFSTLEPCPMCAGAMIQARLERLVYGAKDFRFGADGSVIDVLNEPQFNHRVRVTSGIMEDESAALMQTFFRQLRQTK